MNEKNNQTYSSPAGTLKVNIRNVLTSFQKITPLDFKKPKQYSMVPTYSILTNVSKLVVRLSAPSSLSNLKENNEGLKKCLCLFDIHSCFCLLELFFVLVLLFIVY